MHITDYIDTYSDHFTDGHILKCSNHVESILGALQEPVGEVSIIGLGGKTGELKGFNKDLKVKARLKARSKNCVRRF